jgi:hypothetical protein
MAGTPCRAKVETDADIKLSKTTDTNMSSNGAATLATQLNEERPSRG